ncbi:MAG: hypothetical protein K0Q87_3105 [Neobacillus sp.]|jgi:hypothetical protein|nr:hypothetical protein [Neobacillus sp.]
MIDVPMVDSIGDMLELAMMCCNRPPKAIAADIGYSVDTIYAACKNARAIPNKARQKLSQLNSIAASAVALEATGFAKLFGYQKVDRHVQSMIIRLKKQDKEIFILLEDLPVILLDKNDRNDLSEIELNDLEHTAHRLIDRANSTINLIMELEHKYGLGVTQYMQGKEKSPVLTHRRLS